MAAPTIGRRPGTLPGSLPSIDWSHPLAAGLAYLVIPRGRAMIDLVSGQPLTVRSGATQSRTPYGEGFASTTSTSGAYIATRKTTWTYPLSFVWCGTSVGNSSGAGGLCCTVVTAPGAGEAAPYLCGLTVNASWKPVLSTTNGAITVSQAIAPSNVAAQRTCVAGVIRVSDQRLFVNGEQIATSSHAYTNAQSQAYFAVNDYSTNTTSNSACSIALMYERALENGEVAALTADPFQMLRY